MGGGSALRRARGGGVPEGRSASNSNRLRLICVPVRFACGIVDDRSKPGGREGLRQWPETSGGIRAPHLRRRDDLPSPAGERCRQGGFGRGQERLGVSLPGYRRGEPRAQGDRGDAARGRARHRDGLDLGRKPAVAPSTPVFGSATTMRSASQRPTMSPARRRPVDRTAATLRRQSSPASEPWLRSNVVNPSTAKKIVARGRRLPAVSTPLDVEGLEKRRPVRDARETVAPVEIPEPSDFGARRRHGSLEVKSPRRPRSLQFGLSVAGGPGVAPVLREDDQHDDEKDPRRNEDQREDDGRREEHRVGVHAWRYSARPSRGRTGAAPEVGARCAGGMAATPWDEPRRPSPAHAPAVAFAADAPALAALYADDAVLAMPGMPAAPGGKAIAELFAGLVKDTKITEFVLLESRYETSGHLSAGWGRYRMTMVPKAGGAPVTETGTYCGVATQKGGVWKYVSDDAAADPAPPAPPAKK